MSIQNKVTYYLQNVMDRLQSNCGLSIIFCKEVIT
jgi:hypothetical protein